MKGLVEHSAMQRKNEKACIPCAVRDSAVCTSVNLYPVVPDSFDNYSTQELLLHADTVQSGRFSHDLYSPAQMTINGEMCGLPCHSGISKPGISFHCYLFKRPKIGNGFESKFSIGVGKILFGIWTS